MESKGLDSTLQMHNMISSVHFVYVWRHFFTWHGPYSLPLVLISYTYCEYNNFCTILCTFWNILYWIRCWLEHWVVIVNIFNMNSYSGNTRPLLCCILLSCYYLQKTNHPLLHEPLKHQENLYQITFDFFTNFFPTEIRLDISSELSAKQTIDIKCQALLSMKNKLEKYMFVKISLLCPQLYACLYKNENLEKGHNAKKIINCFFFFFFFFFFLQK